jgi:hypothetical protein
LWVKNLVVSEDFQQQQHEKAQLQNRRIRLTYIDSRSR